MTPAAATSAMALGTDALSGGAGHPAAQYSAHMHTATAVKNSVRPSWPFDKLGENTE